MKAPVWVVKEVQPKDNYTLLLTFADGAKKIYDARPLLEKAIYSQLNTLLKVASALDCDIAVVPIIK